MKTLQRFSELRVSEAEMCQISGGEHVSGSYNILGSNYSYSGELSMTADAGGVLTFSWTGQHSDWCGTASVDGRSGLGCAMLVNGTWTLV